VGKVVDNRGWSINRGIDLVEDGEHTHDSAFVGSQWESDKQDAQDVGLYSADTIYSASETSNLQARGYLVELAGELFGTLRSYGLNRETTERISKMLPNLLRAFALKVGHKAQTPKHLEVSFFVHKYRR